MNQQQHETNSDRAFCRPKSIILFSDGTGNSSAKLFKTNVWRLYEAVDLGSSADQAAYYDNGVGTSSIKILAMVTGIFGFGLKRNLLRLYRFVCRNYQDGDRIYAFGFSRGAFTIRLLIALIAEQGIVRYRSEHELTVLSLDALRAFNSRNNPNTLPGRLLAMGARVIRNGWLSLKRTILGQHVREPLTPYTTDIHFVGVWDTVAAYGGPVAEITRGIDDWIWPLTMTDYCLSPKVKCARHALSIDDERDSFHPLLWDEVDWSRRALAAETTPEAQQAFRDRLRQVWFAGMHADVGGGYPDESLSYVSLYWMMQEASAAGLKLLDEPVARIRSTSNDFGPIHDSRAGFGSYYRYQPRKIAAYLHPDASPEGLRLLQETLILRDPTIGEKEHRPQGLLLSCKLHKSVVTRIASGTDDYAPITLPRMLSLAPPPPPSDLDPNPEPDATAEAALAALQSVSSARARRQEVLWNAVAFRRYYYFIAVALSAALVALPWWMHRLSPIPRTTDGRWVLNRITGWIDPVVPVFLHPWLRALEKAPFYFAGLLILIIVARRLGRSQGAKLHDGMRQAWDSALQGNVPGGPQTSGFMRFRNSFAYQFGFQTLKWRILPNIVGPLLVFLMLWVSMVALTQIALLRQERGGCPRSASYTIVHDTETTRIETAKTCNATGFGVLAKYRYRIVVQRNIMWWDDDVAAGPDGVPASRYPWYVRHLGAPLRRIVTARWMQLLYEVRPPQEEGKTAPEVQINPLHLRQVGADTFVGEFVAPAQGELFLFVNDASTFWDLGYFYRNNKGSAEVTISMVPAS